MIRKGNNSYIGSDQRNTDIGSYEMPKHYLLREDDKYGYEYALSQLKSHQLILHE